MADGRLKKNILSGIVLALNCMHVLSEHSRGVRHLQEKEAAAS